MSSHNQALEKLASLLQGSHATAVISKSVLPPSAIYDVDYRTAVIALIFEKFSSPSGNSGQRRISAARFKLLQFAAMRPAMIGVLTEWSKEVAQSPLALRHSIRMRHAFVGDTAHDDMIKLLVVCGIFQRQGGQILGGNKIEKLTNLVTEITQRGLFAEERNAISELSSIKITNAMLEGW
jgi:hypothetical protein